MHAVGSVHPDCPMHEQASKKEQAKEMSLMVKRLTSKITPFGGVYLLNDK